MRLFYLFLLLLCLLSAACGEREDSPAANSKNTAPVSNNIKNTAPNTAPNTAQPSAPVANENPLDTQKKPEKTEINKGENLKAVADAYFDALKKKDDAAIKKVLSQEAIQGWGKEMASEKKSNLAAYIAESELGDGKPFEVRNEEIKGNKATAEIRGGAYSNWITLEFVNENGGWKWTGESPDFNQVKQAANTSQKLTPKE